MLRKKINKEHVIYLMMAKALQEQGTHKVLKVYRILQRKIAVNNTTEGT